MLRIRLLIVTSIIGATLLNTVRAADRTEPLRIGITPAIVYDRKEPWDAWQHYLEGKLNRPIRFVARDSYRQMLDMVKHGEVDFAWLSTFSYAYVATYFNAKLVAVPLYHGRPYSAAYLIVPAKDVGTKSLLDLRGKVFAYGDMYSLTGYLLPRDQLIRSRQDPDTFFRKTFFSHAHANTVAAVSAGLADGGYVSAFVWDSLAEMQPLLTKNTRIVSKSPDFAFPPLVAINGLPPETVSAFSQALFGMTGEEQGRKVLGLLGIDGFTPGNTSMYAPVVKMVKISNRQ